MTTGLRRDPLAPPKITRRLRAPIFRCPLGILYRENVLDGTKAVCWCILYEENVLGGTEWIRASRICRLGCSRSSDSSAQVLRNSRPEFRLLALRSRMNFLGLRASFRRRSVWQMQDLPPSALEGRTRDSGRAWSCSGQTAAGRLLFIVTSLDEGSILSLNSPKITIFEYV